MTLRLINLIIIIIMSMAKYYSNRMIKGRPLPKMTKEKGEGTQREGLKSRQKTSF